MTTWTVAVEEDPATGDLILPLPPELVQMQGWVEGEELEWINNTDGSWSIKKLDQNDPAKYIDGSWNIKKLDQNDPAK